MLAALTIAAVPGRAELPRRWIKPRPLCHLPSADYRPGPQPSPPVTAVSFAALPLDRLERPGLSDLILPASSKKSIYFQMAQPVLRIDHCFVSRISAVVREDGQYWISFRADQNPRPVGDAAEPIPPGVEVPQVRQVRHIKWNEFTITFRFLGAFPVPEERRNLAPAKPVLAEVKVDPFWVESGVPETKFLHQHAADLGRFFESLERLEVEFFYR